MFSSSCLPLPAVDRLDRATAALCAVRSLLSAAAPGSMIPADELAALLDLTVTEIERVRACNDTN